MSSAVTPQDASAPNEPEEDAGLYKVEKDFRANEDAFVVEGETPVAEFAAGTMVVVVLASSNPHREEVFLMRDLANSSQETVMISKVQLQRLRRRGALVPN